MLEIIISATSHTSSHTLSFQLLAPFICWFWTEMGKNSGSQGEELGYAIVQEK